MPTYDYRCTACKHEFEQFQSMKDAPLRKCPKCAKRTLERLIGTGAALLFKGSGFYQTDYRTEGYKKAAEADKPAASTSGESKPDTKVESKPDSKANAKAETKPAPKPESVVEKHKPAAKSKGK